MGSVYCVSQSLARRRQRSGLGQPHKDGALHKFCCQGTKTREVTFHFTQTGQVFQSDIVKARVSRSWDNFVYMTGLPTTTTPKKLCRDGTDFPVQPYSDWVTAIILSSLSPYLKARQALFSAVPPVLVPRFWYLGSGSYFSIPGFRYKIFGRLFAFLHFGTSLVPFRLHFNSKSAVI